MDNGVPNTYISDILDHSASMMEWLRQPEGRLLEGWLMKLKRSEEHKLLSSSDQTEVFRAQGAIKMLEKILGLPELLAGHQRQPSKAVKSRTTR